MRRLLPPVVLAAYAIGVAVIEIHHEPWRDEADCWLLARDAGLVTFFHRMGLSGTPGLWHLLLVPFARLGAPYATQAVLNVAIAVAAAAIVLWRAPLPLVTRALIVFSYYLGYEYSVIVRSYALSVLLLVAIAALWEKRYERPLLFAALVALLANTNTHSLIIAAMIGVAYLFGPHPPLRGTFSRSAGERQTSAGEGQTSPLAREAGEGGRRAKRGGRVRARAAALLMLAGGIAAVLQLIPPADAISGGAVMRFTPNGFPLAVASAFFPQMASPWTAAAGALIIVAALVALRRDRGALLVLVGTLAGLAYVFTYQWIGGLRHAGFVFLIVLFALWIAQPSRERSIAAWLFTASLVASILVTATAWQLDYRYAFSGAKEMAQFIHRAGLADLPIAAHSETAGSALCPWFRHPFWYPGIGQDGTFTMWDKAFDRGLYVTYPAAEARAVEHFRGKRWLLLFNVEMPYPTAHGFRLLHVTQPPFAHPDERFWLYAPL